MILKKSNQLWKRLGVCGLCISLCSPALGQATRPEGKPNPTNNANNSNGSQNINAQQQPNSNWRDTAYADPNSPQPAQYRPYPGSAPPYLGQQAGAQVQPEMMVFQDGEFRMVTANLGDPELQEAAREGMKILAAASQVLRAEDSSDEKRAEAKKLMTQFLEAHFDHDQQKRHNQLEALEAQVTKLKSQLEKRSKSKAQLIELRLTLLENDSNGLSFPQSWTALPGSESPVLFSNVNYFTNPTLSAFPTPIGYNPALNVYTPAPVDYGTYSLPGGQSSIPGGQSSFPSTQRNRGGQSGTPARQFGADLGPSGSNKPNSSNPPSR